MRVEEVQLQSHATLSGVLAVLRCINPVCWPWCCAQDNLYRLGLLTHLQSAHVPLKVPECLRDLRAMYDAATVDDVHDAYAHFELDDDHVFTCVGTSGPQPPPQLQAQPAPLQGARLWYHCQWSWGLEPEKNARR